MTLPTTTILKGCDDDSDMFGPPRSTYNHHYRSRVPMISPKLRLREERKRILQLCAHKLERIKDSEINLRRSVCINNTYCRLTDELRREKQSRYLANLPKSEIKLETARDNIFNPYNSCWIDSSSHQSSSKSNNHGFSDVNTSTHNNSNSENVQPCNGNNNSLQNRHNAICNSISDNGSYNLNKLNQYQNINNNNNNHNNIASTSSLNHNGNNNNTACNNVNFAINTNHSHGHNNNTATKQITNTSNCTISTAWSIVSSNIKSSSSGSSHTRKRQLSSNNLDTDLEILDRELSEINAPMPLIDPEITQGAEQLERAISSRKRSRSEDESDRLVREALSQFYIPQQRLISAIEDCPLDVVSVGVGANSVGVGLGVSMSLGMGVGVGITSMNGNKRQKLNANVIPSEIEVEFDLNQNQKDFEVIMDALRLGTSSPTSSMGSDSCGQAAMMSESASVFHNLVVTSLET